MGVIKQKMLEEQWEEDWVSDQVADGNLIAITEKITDLQLNVSILESELHQLKNYNADILQALCMVAHVVKSFGFNNPAVQATRLDPDNIGDATRIIDEAFSILETPVLGRRVSHLVESTLRGKWEELEKQLVQEDK
jgi:hypothetical protein